MGRRIVVLAVVLGLTATTAGVAGPAQVAGAAPTTVTIAGSFQSELGCPGDWQPECALTQLTLDPDDGVWQASFALPAGTWEYKAALDGSWDENYGAGAVRDGPNIVIDLASPTTVRFFYDHGTHWVTDDVTSVIATVPGSFQSELGCAADWDPACLRSWLQDADGDGIARFSTSTLPPGDYEAKVAIDQAWDENYGAGGLRDGPNIPFTVSGAGDVVSFSYDTISHVLEIGVVPAEPVDDTALVREPVRHPFVDEMLYFAMPDRFADGDPANNCGDFAGRVRGGRHAGERAHPRLPAERQGLLPRRRPRGPAAQAAVPQPAGCQRGVGGAHLRQQERPGRQHQPVRALVRLPRLLDPRLPAGGPAPRHQRRVRPPGGRGAPARHQGVHGHRHQPHRRRHPAGGQRRVSQQDGVPLPRHRRPALRRLGLRLLGPARLHVPRGRHDLVPLCAGGAARRAQEPGLAERPAAVPQPGQHQLLRRELALRRLLRARRPVDRAPRGGRGHGRHLLVLDRRVRRRRLPHRHHQARQHGVLAALRPGHPGGGPRPRHRRLLRLRRGVRPAVRLALHERVLDPGAAAGHHRLRLPAGGPRLRLAGRGHRRPAGLLRLRRLVHRRRQQRLRDADVPREPRHGAHRLLPATGRPAGRGRRRVARPLAAGTRPDVLLPRPARRLLRRRAGLHRRRRRQGRPRGHVRQRGVGLRRQRPHRDRRDHLGRQLRPGPPAVPDHLPLHPACASAIPH